MQDFNDQYYSTTIRELQLYHKFKSRTFPSFKFGPQENCKQILRKAMLDGDKTIKQLIWISEYDEVADWLSNTAGKGLLLTGDVGLGKTVITQYALPILFSFHMKKVVNRVRSIDLGERFDELKKKKIIAIDDMGIEAEINEFGNRYEPIERIINIAESEGKILLISSNLNAADIIERYDVRTLDRIKRLCRPIKFQGDSFRK